jgi:hypothetical protein
MLIVSTCTPFKDIIKIKETSYSTTDTASSASHLGSGITFGVRDIYSIYKCRWNVATHINGMLTM